ncbi:MAG: 16S rRNA (uracil(1498)-N(3))-methyltransferase [Firmicutes bacterium]|nr:16S rRNA (uracil(1498)-N(3))-methyltransferase [Bacillota bacterium]
MTARFFVEPDQIVGDMVTIQGEELAHLARVLRLGPGDAVTICDGTGMEYYGILEEVLPDAAAARIRERIVSPGEPRTRITLVQGLPKADKMDLIIKKGTEVGISQFIPVITERTIVQLTAGKAGRRVERWQRIAKEAAKQCRRAVIPKVHHPLQWRECIDRYLMDDRGRLGLIPWEEIAGTGTGLREVLTSAADWDDAGRALNTWLFIGPEGGFSEAEVQQAAAAGILTVSLGPRILRTETAGPITAALILYQRGELG